MNRFCLDCSNKLIGRSDKKFCDDSCRSNYNNKKHNSETIIIREVNRTIKKNHKILVKFNLTGKTKVAITKLQKEGFSFDYFTSIFRTENGAEYRYCYDQGYLVLNEKEALLVRNILIQ